MTTAMLAPMLPFPSIDALLASAAAAPFALAIAGLAVRGPDYVHDRLRRLLLSKRRYLRYDDHRARVTAVAADTAQSLRAVADALSAQSVEGHDHSRYRVLSNGSTALRTVATALDNDLARIARLPRHAQLGELLPVIARSADGLGVHVAAADGQTRVAAAQLIGRLRAVYAFETSFLEALDTALKHGYGAYRQRWAGQRWTGAELNRTVADHQIEAAGRLRVRRWDQLQEPYLLDPRGAGVQPAPGEHAGRHTPASNAVPGATVPMVAALRKLLSPGGGAAPAADATGPGAPAGSPPPARAVHLPGGFTISVGRRPGRAAGRSQNPGAGRGGRGQGPRQSG